MELGEREKKKKKRKTKGFKLKPQIVMHLYTV